MHDYRAWQYDEFKSVGRDYSDPEEVRIYGLPLTMLAAVDTELAASVASKYNHPR